jgi:chromosome segregation ATPase
MISIGAIKLQVSAAAIDAQRETFDVASERLERLDARKAELSSSIERQEDQVEHLQLEMIGEKGDDLAELREEAERVTAGIERDTSVLDVVAEEPKEQFDRVTEQVERTNNGLRGMTDATSDMFEATMRGFA